MENKEPIHPSELWTAKMISVDDVIKSHVKAERARLRAAVEKMKADIEFEDDVVVKAYNLAFDDVLKLLTDEEGKGTGEKE